MKTLKESLFSDIDDTLKQGNKGLKEMVKEFLKANYSRASKFKISRKPNADGLFEVTYLGILVPKDHSITKLTNELFIFT